MHLPTQRDSEPVTPVRGHVCRRTPARLLELCGPTGIRVEREP